MLGSLATFVLFAAVFVSLFKTRRLRLPIAAINGRYFRPAPRIDDPKIGKSQGLPIALEFRIGANASGFPGGIGRIVHQALFPGVPDFSVHIKFACARPSLLGARSDFANPRSIWYNVFVGYYQIEVDQAEWGRPFAYDLLGYQDGKPNLEELARLARADWNHLSNQLYGVPARAIAPINALGLDDLQRAYEGRVRKEGWDGALDVISFENLKVVSPGSTKGGDDYERGGLCGPLWRRSFGTHTERREGESFAPCCLRMRAYMCFDSAVGRSGKPVYRTFVFGGGVNHGYDAVDAAENARFLELQMAALEQIIRGERGLGFRGGA